MGAIKHERTSSGPSAGTASAASPAVRRGVRTWAMPRIFNRTRERGAEMPSRSTGVGLEDRPTSRQEFPLFPSLLLRLEILIVFAIFALLIGIMQRSAGAFSAASGGFPDEPAHL